jgi:flagellar hook assembly protein FlgD
MGAFDGGCVGTAVETPQTPARFALHQNVPNPFNPTTTITYDVPANGGQITIKVYDVSGRLIRALIDGMQTAGAKSVQWNGRNENGTSVATGVYFYKMTAPGYVKTRKMVLLQ